MILAGTSQRNCVKYLVIRRVGRPRHDPSHFLVIPPHGLDQRRKLFGRSGGTGTCNSGRRIQKRVGRKMITSILIKQYPHVRRQVQRGKKFLVEAPASDYINRTLTDAACPYGKES